MKITASYSAATENLWRVVFLRLGLARALRRPFMSAAPGLDKATQDFISEIYDDLIRATDDTRPSKKDVNALIRDIIARYRLALSSATGVDKSFLRPACSEVIGYMRKLRARADAQEPRDPMYDWRSLCIDDLPEPTEALHWYAVQVEKSRELVENLYRDVLEGSGLSVHVNLTLIMQGSEGETFKSLLADVSTGGRPIFGKTLPAASFDKDFNPDPGNSPYRACEITVELPIVPDRNAAFGLPYTVAHEIGVHALQRLSNPEGSVSDGSLWAFSEGMMDALVFETLCAAVADPNSDIDKDDELGAKKRYNTRVNEQRPSISKNEDICLWEQRLVLGRESWQSIKNLGRAAKAANFKLGFEPEEWARRVVLKLNVLDLSPVERARLLNGLQEAIGHSPIGECFEIKFVGKDPADRRIHPVLSFVLAARHIISIDDLGVCTEKLRMLIKNTPEMAIKGLGAS